jgi:hypothetical protein
LASVEKVIVVLKLDLKRFFSFLVLDNGFEIETLIVFFCSVLKFFFFFFFLVPDDDHVICCTSVIIVWQKYTFGPSI